MMNAMQKLPEKVRHRKSEAEAMTTGNIKLNDVA